MVNDALLSFWASRAFFQKHDAVMPEAYHVPHRIKMSASVMLAAVSNDIFT
jgi:hypothetical protein